MEIEQEELNGVAILTPLLPDSTIGWTATLKTMRNRVNVLTDRGARKLLIDLTNVDFLDSTGIGTLVGCFQRMASTDGLVLFCGAGLRIAETLAVVNLLRVLPLRIGRAEAMKELSKSTPTKGACAKLSAGNPSVDTLRAWWKDNAPAPSPAPEAPPEPAPASPAAQQPKSPDPAAALSENLPSDVHDDLRSWVDALDVLMRARGIYERNGLGFSADVTFKEFIARLAEALIERRK